MQCNLTVTSLVAKPWDLNQSNYFLNASHCRKCKWMWQLGLKSTKSKTVQGMEKLFSDDEIEVIIWSEIWSILSFVIGQLQWQSTKTNGTLTMKGELLLSIFFLLSLLIRIFAVLIYFAPAFGLWDLLCHWTMGSLKTSTEYQVSIFRNILWNNDFWKVLTCLFNLKGRP